MYACAIAVHLLAAIVWIGGMFFAYICLAPSLAETLEPPQAPRVLAASFARFFRWVWCAVVVLLVSGFYMTIARFELAHAPLWLYLMLGLGSIMMLLFAHVYFAPYARLNRALAAKDMDVVRQSVKQIRQVVAINLVLGAIIAVGVSLGRYL